jgi:hypothetical protein
MIIRVIKPRNEAEFVPFSALSFILFWLQRFLKQVSEFSDFAIANATVLTSVADFPVYNLVLLL